ncbi:XisI protein [Roseofilum reptotaenium CS-1145]|uniref:XisI protein n=1 Tax=Roseofilum reptotaenium AO1-A TaxID=1925591 RepID=A0A1L9QR61_9CYAN|nr:XisI protein [Roseofilum reptotaenium]MDB9516118.1 XisI protein [Roseofilum reptotaenium CS-1145]OJJ25067.1 XisI protein [Roseofilum reptotaenium AO1-A]
MDNLEQTSKIKIENYREIIQTFLRKYASYKPSHGEIEIQTLFDTQEDHYQVLGVGWDGKQRIYGCSIHLDIKNGKIWLQLNNTALDVAQELVEMGVLKTDIVIAFQPPSIRAVSGYAMG